MDNLRNSLVLLQPTPADAKLFGWYVSGGNVVIETIAQYLARVPVKHRSPDAPVTMQLPKAGYTSLGTYTVAEFKGGILANFEGHYYTFVGGLADENFVEILFDIPEPDTITEITENTTADGKHTHKLILPVKGITDLVKTIAGNNHESFLIENTAAETETVESSWSVLPYAEQVGEFKAVVMVRNKTLNTIITNMSLLSFDYTDAVSVVLQSDMISSALTLTVGVNVDNKLYATIDGMTTDNKRIHLCFERCVLSERTFGLEAEFAVEMQMQAILTSLIDLVVAPIEMGLGMSANLYRFEELAAAIEVGMGMEADITDDSSVADELLLTWDNIANVPVADASSVADWNTYFDLPTFGTPFTSVVVTGNVVNLIGGSGITLKANLFGESEITGGDLIGIVDNSSCIIACEDGVFSAYDLETIGCYGLITVHLPACEILGNAVFADCESLSDLVLPTNSYTALGDNLFNGCISLAGTISFPNVLTAGNFCFTYCRSIGVFDFPLLHTAGTSCFLSTLASHYYIPSLVNAGYGCFNMCSGALEFDFPLLQIAGGLSFAENTLATLSFPSLINAGSGCFHRNPFLISISLPAVEFIGDSCFSENYSIETLYMPSLLNLGDTVSLEDVFGSTISGGITAQIITLTIPAALMTCNSGNPDGDIQYLQLYNTVTIIQV